MSSKQAEWKWGYVGRLTKEGTKGEWVVRER